MTIERQTESPNGIQSGLIYGHGPQHILSMLALGAVTLLVGSMMADDTPMALDEAITFAIVDRSFGGFMSVLRTEGVAMGPYHLGLWIWTQFGDSDWWVRMFSVLGGVVTVCLLFKLALRWMGYGPAVGACVVLIANPLFHRYLTDARSYSWLMAIAVLMVIAADRLIRERRTMDAVILGATVGLGIASHITFITMIGSLLVALVIAREIDRLLFRRLIVAGSVAAVIVAPVVVLVLTRRGELAQNAPATPFRFAAVTSTAFGSLPTSPILLLGIGFVVLAVITRRQSNWPHICLAAMAIGPPILLGAISIVGDDVYNSRYLSPLIPFAAACAVAGYRLIWPKHQDMIVPLGVAVASVVAGFFGPSVDAARNADPISATRFLEANVQSDDVVLFEPGFNRIYIARYWGYRPDLDPVLIRWEDSALHPPVRPLGEVIETVENARSIWVVTLLADSALQAEVQGDRVATSQAFRRLRVIELAQPQD